MYDTYHTMTGLTLGDVQERLDEELPANAYKRLPGASDLTDIDPAHMRRVLNEVFGLCAVGWGYRYDPATVTRSTFEFTNARGEVKTRHEATVTGLVFWYKVVDGEGRCAVCEIPATGGSENSSAAFALKGALTNALGNAVSNIGFQQSVYMGLRSHRTVGAGGNGASHAGNGRGNGKNAAAIEVKFGKYANQTLQWVATQAPEGDGPGDLEYLEWLAKEWKWDKGRQAAAAVLTHYRKQAAPTPS